MKAIILLCLIYTLSFSIHSQVIVGSCIEASNAKTIQKELKKYIQTQKKGLDQW